MVVLILGSNLGDRLGYLSRTIELLHPALKNLKFSSIYETQAVLPENAPSDWDKPYLNIAVRGETDLSPQDLLKKAKEIETKLGRAKEHPVWSPREIDVDIAVYGQEQIQSNNLTIPHKGLLERDFFIIPMAEIAPDWVCVVEGKYEGITIAEIASKKYPHLPETIKKTDLCLQPAKPPSLG